MFLHRASAMSFQHSSFPGLKSIWKGNQSRIKLSWNFLSPLVDLAGLWVESSVQLQKSLLLRISHRVSFLSMWMPGLTTAPFFLWLPGSPECRVKLMVQGWQLHQCTEAEHDFSPLAALSPLISFFPCSEFSLFLYICHVIVSLNVSLFLYICHVIVSLNVSLYETWVTSILSISSVKLRVFICV